MVVRANSFARGFFICSIRSRFLSCAPGNLLRSVSLQILIEIPILPIGSYNVGKGCLARFAIVRGQVLSLADIAARTLVSGANRFKSISYKHTASRASLPTHSPKYPSCQCMFADPYCHDIVDRFGMKNR